MSHDKEQLDALERALYPKHIGGWKCWTLVSLFLPVNILGVLGIISFPNTGWGNLGMLACNFALIYPLWRILIRHEMV